MSDLPEPVRAFLDQGGEQLVLATSTDAGPGRRRGPAGAGVRRKVRARARRRRRPGRPPGCGGAARRPGARGGGVGRVAAVVAGLRPATGVAADEGVPDAAGRRRVPRGRPVRAAGPGRQRGPRAGPAVRLAGARWRRAAWSSTTGPGPSRPSRSATSRRTSVLAPTGPLAEHHVTGRAPVVVESDDIGPFDERVFNPIGFESVVDGPVVELASLRGQRPTEGLVRSLRSSVGVTGRIERLPPTPRWRGRRPVHVRRPGRAAGRRRCEARPVRPVGARGAPRGATPGGATRRSRRRPGGDSWPTGPGVRVAPRAVGERGARDQAAGDARLRAAAGPQAARRRPPAGAGAARLHPGRRRAARARARPPRRPAAGRGRCCSATCSPTPSRPPTATWC